MGIARTLKRKQQQEVKKMYDREMRKMDAMTDERKITHLAHLQSRLKPSEETVQTIEPVDVI